jgi:hypothetical protein
MTDRARASAPFVTHGASGLAHYGGVLWSDDPDKAWRGAERDRTIRAMIASPEIGAILHGIEMLVRRVDWSIEPADESPAATDLATFIEECLADMDGYWPGDTLSAILSYIPWGWYAGELIYKRRGGPEQADPTQRSAFDDGRIGWRRWATRPQATRYGWAFDDAGDVTALIQQDPVGFQKYEIPIERLLHIVYSGKTNSPEGWTPLRPAYDAWYYKRAIQKIEGIGIERDLAGIPMIRMPASVMQEGDPLYAAYQQMVTNLRNGDQAGIILPSDSNQDGGKQYEFELIKSGGGKAFDTDPVVRRYANEIVTVFLANVMRTGQDGIGALALSETQSGLFQSAIGAHLDIVADAINTQAIPRLLRLNGLDSELAPRLKPGRIDSRDLQNLGLYLVRLANTGTLIDSPELREFLHTVAGLPINDLPTADEIKQQRAEWAATKGSGDAPPDGGA